jgi:hypothetical protein
MSNSENVLYLVTCERNLKWKMNNPDKEAKGPTKVFRTRAKARRYVEKKASYRSSYNWTLERATWGPDNV